MRSARPGAGAVVARERCAGAVQTLRDKSAAPWVGRDMLGYSESNEVNGVACIFVLHLSIANVDKRFEACLTPNITSLHTRSMVARPQHLCQPEARSLGSC